ncbi:hypothetical protein [Roseicyclus marinus]|uniref:hypothetical protein n=1 Tax=Roseicyclus marinus TaxID=2161673 RepID=UPI00240F65BA|nr:hypothetical protein [Roseicyclus marinus]MDG3040434.1 hypothetical protein [Roseicyclus marinus]
MTLPVLGPNMISGMPRRTLRAARAGDPSFATGTEQVQDWGGRWWEYDITIAASRDENARALGALFAQIVDVGRFLFADPDAETSSSLGTPVVDGASQTGGTLNVTGLAAGSPLIKAGAFLSLGTEGDTRFHRILADVTPDGSGNAALSIVPSLRSSPANGAAVEINAPKVLLRPVSDIPESVANGDIHSFSFTAREAI